MNSGNTHTLTYTPTVSAIAVIDLAEELRLHGCLQTAQFEELGPEFLKARRHWQAQRNIQEERLPEVLMRKLWQVAQKTAAKGCLGLCIGAKVNPQAKGILANWLAQCDNLSAAFEIFSQHIHLLNPAECWSIQKTEESVKLSLSFEQNDYPAMAIDRSIAALLAWGTYYCNKPIIPMVVHLKRSPPQNIELYEQHLGPNILFSQSEDAIYFHPQDFQQKIESANPYLRDLIAEQAAKLEHCSQPATPWTNKVLGLLRQQLNVFGHIETVCDYLQLSRTSLYRKLKMEGHSYTELLKLERMRQFSAAQKHQLSAAEIAEQLGFKDIASFYRFKRQQLTPLNDQNLNAAHKKRR